MNLKSSSTLSRAAETSEAAAESVVEVGGSLSVGSEQVQSYEQIVFPQSPHVKYPPLTRFKTMKQKPTCLTLPELPSDDDCW